MEEFGKEVAIFVVELSHFPVAFQSTLAESHLHENKKKGSHALSYCLIVLSRIDLLQFSETNTLLCSRIVTFYCLYNQLGRSQACV